jgi:hypothetical protein
MQAREMHTEAGAKQDHAHEPQEQGEDDRRLVADRLPVAVHLGDRRIVGQLDQPGDQQEQTDEEDDTEENEFRAHKHSRFNGDERFFLGNPSGRILGKNSLLG